MLVSCSRPPEREATSCTITVRPGELLQAAIDRAPAGAVICIPSGTWTESLRVTKPLTLRGAGSTRTTVRGAQLLHSVLTIEPSGEAEGPVIVSGIQFTGARGSCSDPGGCAHGLLVAGKATVEVSDCVFSQNEGSGVTLRDRGRATIHGSTIQGNGAHGVQAVGQAEAILSSVTISGSRGSGIWLSDAARLVLATSTVTKCEGHGLWIRDRSQLTATDSTVSFCGGRGVWIRDQASASLSRCTIRGHQGTGVRCEHTADVALAACLIQQVWDGVEARDSCRIRVTECTVSAIRWDGIKLLGSTQATIRGSTISDGRGSGISIGGGAQATISHNRIHSWTAQGILALSRLSPEGEGNAMSKNGVDLVGNLSGSVRAPLRTPTLEEVRFPSPGYATLQEAVDSLHPGGRLVLEAGIYPAGITVGKPMRIEAEGVVLLTARSPSESAVISLVTGADLYLTGTALSRGSEALVLGGDARANLTDCVLSDNLRGIHASDDTTVQLLRCRISRNEQGGMWLWGKARAEVRESTFTQNAVCGIGGGGTATVSVHTCHITESGWNGGIVLRDSAQAEIQGNAIVRSYGAGIALYHGLCIGSGYRFTGRIFGGGNTFDGNYKGSVCPPELEFLAGEGGELDWRR